MAKKKILRANTTTPRVAKLQALVTDLIRSVVLSPMLSIKDLKALDGFRQRLSTSLDTNPYRVQMFTSPSQKTLEKSEDILEAVFQLLQEAQQLHEQANGETSSEAAKYARNQAHRLEVSASEILQQ